MTLLKSKIHQATVTDANINYRGSITIDSALLKAANLYEFEKVQVASIDTGARLETYTIKGKGGSGTIQLNGAAAKLIKKGERIIIMAFAQVNAKEAQSFKPTIICLNEKNKISQIANQNLDGLDSHLNRFN